MRGKRDQKLPVRQGYLSDEKNAWILRKSETVKANSKAIRRTGRNAGKRFCAGPNCNAIADYRNIWQRMACTLPAFPQRSFSCP